MSLFPKKNLIWVFDSVVPSKYVNKCRRFFFFDPYIGNDLATRAGSPITGATSARRLQKT